MATDVASAIKAARLARGMKINQVAEASGLSRRTIMRLECSRPVTAETLLKVRTVLEPALVQAHDQGENARLGRALRVLRQNAEESLEVIAGSLGRSASSLSRIERGSPPRGGWEDFLSNDDLARSLGLRDANDLMAEVEFVAPLDRTGGDSAAQND